MNVTELLGPGGDARAHFKASNGDWVDGFFDQVVALLQKTHLEDLTLKFGAASANVVTTGEGVQLNVRWAKDRGWSCYTAADFDSALAVMWQQINLINDLKGPQDVPTGQQEQTQP
jgi:hypothetical protein